MICNDYQGTVDVAHTQSGVVLNYVGMKNHDGHTYETSIHVAPTSSEAKMQNCYQAGESKQCNTISGEVEFSKK